MCLDILPNMRVARVRNLPRICLPRSLFRSALHRAVALRAPLAERGAARADVADLGFDTGAGAWLGPDGALALKCVERLRPIFPSASLSYP
jgi:hypothetical protein